MEEQNNFPSEENENEELEQEAARQMKEAEEKLNQAEGEVESVDNEGKDQPDEEDSLMADSQTSTQSLPPKEELVTMTRSQLDEIVNKVRDETNKRIEEAENRMEALRRTYEQKEQLSYLERRGQESTRDRIEVNQTGPLNPPDHMGRLEREARRDGNLNNNQQSRWVNSDNKELHSLRRAQGYKPVKDGDGNEVRFMDTTLMAMPKQEYEENVKRPSEERKAHHRRASAQHQFEQAAESEGIRTEGSISYDTEELSKK